MFCSKCGKILPDDAKFCDGCGMQMGNAAPAAPQYNAAPNYAYNAAPAAAPNPMFNDFTKAIVGFFTKGPEKTIAASSKSAGIEWVLLSLVSILTYALALPVNFAEILGDYSSFVDYSFGLWLLWGFLLAAGTFFMVSFLIFAVINTVFKKGVNINSVFNMVATAALPLACAWLLNMLAGLIWAPLTVIFGAIAILFAVMLLYYGLKQLVGAQGDAIMAFVIAIAIAILVLGIVAYFMADSNIGRAVYSLALSE